MQNGYANKPRTGIEKIEFQKQEPPCHVRLERSVVDYKP
jgi:hypothetical protein